MNDSVNDTGNEIVNDPVRHPGPSIRGDDQSGSPGRAARRWPLVLLALPAVVAIWSGWVELGQMAGFGMVRPLPGIADGFELNTAITLPVGVEAYSAYALGTWLSGRPIPPAARRFAAWSSLAALALGLIGQVVYHLLTSLGHRVAPLPVVVFVACLPVLVLGAGAALHHLLGDPTTLATAPPVAAAVDVAWPAPATTAALTTAPASALVSPPVRARRAAGQRSAKARKPVPLPRRLLADYLTEARAQIAPGIDPTPAWCRQATGCSRGTSVKLAAALRAEPAPDQPTGRPVNGPERDREEFAA